MSFNVQNDDGTVTDANAYVTVQYFKDYNDDRGKSYSSYTDAQIQVAIIKATDYADYRFAYKGVRKNPIKEQRTEFPRNNLVDFTSSSRQSGVDTWTYYITGIPTLLKEAVCEYAFRSLSEDLVSDPSNNVYSQNLLSKKESLANGEITETLKFASSSFKFPVYPPADFKLQALGVIDNQFELVRG